jgi:metallophosphoesterase (TIGR00282 family)
MRILYIGDVMGEPGLELVERVLPGLRKDKKVDFIVAQAENLTEGKGIALTDYQRLRKAGVDFCTGGNWSLYREEIISVMNDPAQPIIRPANYPVGTPGLGYKYAATPHGRVLFISLLGQVVGRDAEKLIDNPLHIVDAILEQEKDQPRIATIVNFHGDYSSEKRVIGYYLDGRVTAVVGDHWHIPTADAMVLPRGTAHITDVGMCGTLDSSLGVKMQIIIDRWYSGQPSRNVLESTGRLQFNALCIDTNADGLADTLEHIQMTDD